MKTASDRKMIIMMSSTVSPSESSDVELKSTTGSATDDEDLNSSLTESLRTYIRTKGNPLRQTPVRVENAISERHQCCSHSSRRHHRQPCKNRYSNSEAGREARRRCGCGCCQLCLLLLKCTGLLCYVFCCPPVPEMITRKLAFHPLGRGRTYLVSGQDARRERIHTNNAKKAAKLTSLLFEPKKIIEGRPVSMTGVETTIVKTRRGSFLPVVWIKYPIIEGQHVELDNLVVLFSQPNSSDLGCYFQPRGLNLRNLADLLQVQLYAYDYSGYGISSGTSSEKNIYADIEAVYKYICETRGPHVRIVLLGYSIGTAPTIYMASKRPQNLCGIVIIAPFTSGLRLYSRRDEKCCMDRFLSYERAPDVAVPVLICHGANDDVIPISHSQILLERFPRAVTPMFVEYANHLTIFSGRYLSVFLRIQQFLLHETDPLSVRTA